MDNFQAGLSAVTPTGPACDGKGSPARDAEGISAKAIVPAAQMVEEGRAAELQEDVGRPLPKTLPCGSLLEESEALAALGSWALVCGFDIASAWPEPGVAGGRWSWAVALVALLFATLFLAADWLRTLGGGRHARPSGGTLARFMKSRPWALAAHVMLLGGCFLWLMLHAAAQRGPQVCVGVATFWTLLSLAAVRLATCAREAATERCKAARHGTPHGKPEEGSCVLPAKQIAGSHGALWTASSDHSGEDVSGQCHRVAPIAVAPSGNASGSVEVEAAGGTPPSTPGQVQPPGVTDQAAGAASPCLENCQTCGSPMRQTSSGSRQQPRWKPLFPESRGESPVSPAPVRPPTADVSPQTPPLPNTACPTLAVVRGAPSPAPHALPRTWSNEQSRGPGPEEKGGTPTNFKAPNGRPAVGQSLFNDPWQLQASGTGHWDDGKDLPLRIRNKGPAGTSTGASKYGSGTKSQSPVASNSPAGATSRSEANDLVQVVASTPDASAAPTAAPGAVASARAGSPLDFVDATAEVEEVRAKGSPGGATAAAGSAAPAAGMSPVSAAAAAATASVTASVIAAAADSAAGSSRADSKDACSSLGAISGCAPQAPSSGNSSPAKSEIWGPAMSPPSEEEEKHEGEASKKEKSEDTSVHSSQSAKIEPVTRISLVIPSSTANQLEIPGRGGRKKTNPSLSYVPVHEESNDASQATEAELDAAKSPVASPDSSPKNSSKGQGATLENLANFGIESGAPPEVTHKEETKVDAGGAAASADNIAVNGAGKHVKEPTGLKTPPKEDNNPAPEDESRIDPEVLRKAILSNIRRRPVAIGDPVGGGRVEELHEILFRDEDERQSGPHLASDYAGSKWGDPDSLMPDEESHDSGQTKLDFLNGDGMNSDSFQKLREHYHSAEVQMPMMPSLQPPPGQGGPSLWPKLLNSIQNSIVHSRGSRRPSFLPGGDQVSMSRRASTMRDLVSSNHHSANHTAHHSAANSLHQSVHHSVHQSVHHSANGSRRGSHSNTAANHSANGSRRGSHSKEAGSRQGSRMGSQRGSRAGSRAGSRRGSRQASRSNSFVAEQDLVNSRKMSTVSDMPRRNSLMLPNGVAPNGSNESESTDGQDQCPYCGNVYMFDAKFCRKCGVERVQAEHAAGDDAGGKDDGGKGPRQRRRKSSLLKVGAHSIGAPLSPVIQLGQVLEAVAEGAEKSGSDKRKEGALLRHPTPRKTAPAAVMSVLTPQVVKRMAENDVPSGDASAGSPGGSHDVTPSLNSPCESPALSEAVPVSLTINGVEVAESHVTPKPRCASGEELEGKLGKENETESERGAEENEEDEEAKVEAERLRTALAIHPPNMTLKDLFNRDSGVGDVSLESLRRVAADWARDKDAEHRWKQQDGDDDSSEDDSNSDGDGSSSGDGDGEEDEDEDEDDDEPGLYDPILDQLNLDPGMVSEALKMLMMLNDGFKAHHCNCKPQGPHTCMSPAVSQLASQVQTALHSLDVSLSASLAGSVAVSRRSSVHHTRRSSAADGLKAARHRRSSGENKHFLDETGGWNEAKRTSKIKLQGSEDSLSPGDGASPTMSGDSKENSPSITPHASPAHKKNRRSLEGVKKSVEEQQPPPPPFSGEKEKNGGSPISSRLHESRGSAMLGTRGWRIGGSHVHFSGAEPCGNDACNTADAGAGPSSSK